MLAQQKKQPQRHAHFGDTPPYSWDHPPTYLNRLQNVSLSLGVDGILLATHYGSLRRGGGEGREGRKLLSQRARKMNILPLPCMGIHAHQHAEYTEGALAFPGIVLCFADTKSLLLALQHSVHKGWVVNTHMHKPSTQTHIHTPSSRPSWHRFYQNQLRFAS